MSSSSRTLLARVDRDAADRDMRHVARMLAAIAQECSLLGNGISRVGDVLSNDAIAFGDAQALELQSLDALAQNAHAQAKLIAHLTRVLLQGSGGSLAEWTAQIDDVPLPAVRGRLRGAIGAPAASGLHRADDDEVTFWLEELGAASAAKAGG